MKEFMRQKVRNRAEENKAEASASQSRSIAGREKNRTLETTKAIVGPNTNQEKIVTYEDAFSKIQAAPGICDIDELVQNFINAEDQNFTLFKYNNELTADMEKLEQQITDTRRSTQR